MKKLLTIILMIAVLLGNSSTIIFAEEVATTTPEPTPVTKTIEARRAGEAEEAEKADKADKADEAEALNTPTPEPTVAPVQDQNVNTVSPLTDVVDENTSTGGNTNTDTAINTGDANNTSNIANTGNNNYATSGSGTGSGSGTEGASVVNSSNGTGSDNTGSATVVNNDEANQTNSAVVVNNSYQSATTGNNDNSRNTGGDSSITTGDANVTGTLLTSANTNVDGIAVSEFNIVDDHTGDFVLDFTANCIVGCGGTTNVANTGNGADSNNTATSNNLNNSTTNQVNDGDVTNNLVFSADSGNNDASRNTGGDSSITTGDANVAANLMTFLNNNIAGGVMFGVVNIFGDLVGDILLPENVFDQFNCGDCSGTTNVANANNGADSQNLAGATNETNNNVFQSNDANIQNNLIFDVNTGYNEVESNTNGDNSIKTGNILVDANVLNMANMNMIGENMWLVIVNEAGNWIGKLFGAPSGSNIAGSEGMSFAMDPNGVINVTNANNGAGSTNTGSSNTVNNNNLNQTNTANVVNNVTLDANTGYNDASRNTGGNSSIVTGDAQAIANIVNFVNNNIAGGKLLVTFVNVFGSWKGDFMTPGAKKDTSPVMAQGGVENNSNNTTSSKSNDVNENESQQVASSSNTPSPVKKLIAAVGFAGGSANVTDEEEGEVKVAGVNNSGVVAGISNETETKSATINLAWLLLALPLAAGVILARKKYISHKSA